MIGGDDEAFEKAEPIFATVAPGVDAAPRTPGRDGKVAEPEKGYLHCGPTGAGHFVKMVHNGIEYGMMASLAEGLNILRNADIGARVQQGDAETAPLSNPECYQYNFNVADVAEVCAGAVSSGRGCWTSPRARCTSRPSSRSSPDGFQIPERAAGPRSRRSTKAFPRRC